MNVDPTVRELLTSDGWTETDTGDVCADCVADASAADHVDEFDGDDLS